MVTFTTIITSMRGKMRKGVLWFLRDPAENHHWVAEILQKPVMSHLRRLLSTMLLYGVIIVVEVGVFIWGWHLVGRHILRQHIFPLRYSYV